MTENKRQFGLSYKGINYALVEGYPTFEFTEESASAEERIIIHKDDLNAFIDAAMPPPTVFGGSVQLLARKPLPGAPSLTLKTISGAPLNDDLPQDLFGEYGFDDGNKNQYLFLDLSYETEKTEDQDRNENDPTTFLEVGFDTSADFMKMPVTKLAMSGEKNGEGTTSKGYYEATESEINWDPDIPALKVIPVTNYTVTWKYVLNPDFDVFRSLIGHINSGRDKLFYDAPPETILFMGFSGKRTFLYNSDGSTTITPWDLTFKFVGKQIQAMTRTEDGDPDFPQVDIDTTRVGWQHAYRPKTGLWEYVITANGTNIYPETTNFTDMFKDAGVIQ